VQGCILRSPVADRNPDQQVLGICLGILDKNVEIAVVIEHTGVEQFVLRLLAAAPVIRLHQVTIRIGCLGILVEILHIGVGRRAVQIEVVLLDILAMIPLAVGQPEQPLLDDGVPAVPEP